MDKATISDKDAFEGNKLIAEFMGADSLPHLPFNLSGCKYHSSWDWLMPVVEKIENIELDEHTPVAVNIECLECEVKDYRKGQSSFSYYEGKTKIEAVWMAVIEFIKWRNQNINK